MTTLMVQCTCPDEASSQRIARALVDERLAACVSIVPGVASVYRWQGKVTEDVEHLLLIKTTRQRYAAMQQRIVALHPYELPQVVAVKVSAGLEPYLAWVAQSVVD